MVARKSRKGKKAWRKNISDDAELAALKRAHENEEVAALKDSELFQLDKSGDDKTAAAVIQGGKVNQPTVFRKYSFLKAEKEKRKAEAIDAFRKKKRKAGQGHVYVRDGGGKRSGRKKGGKFTDPWGEEEKVDCDDWNVPKNLKDLHPGSSYRKQRLKALRRRNRSAVVVDKPGCSFNPDSGHHQRSIAEAVAVEQAKVIKETMRPRLMAPDEYVEPMDELDDLLAGVDNEDPEEEVEEESGGGIVRKATTADDRKTKTVRNKEARLKKLREELAAMKKNKEMLQQIENVGEIVKEIEYEEKLLENLRTRRKINQAEKAETRPPRLGKEKFEPAAIQVLCTDEVSGSLRQLKPSIMLCKDVVKGFERLGAVEPSRGSLLSKKKPRGKTYLVGEHTEKMQNIVCEGKGLKERVRLLEKQVSSLKP